jgi:uncharacterized protein (TIGR02453 family)
VPKSSRFPGFSPEGLAFVRELEHNNTREWFQPRKADYERLLKEPALAFAEALNAEFNRFAPDYVTDPKKALFRIYRDTRFSSDKTPYKTHVALNFMRRGMEKLAGAGFYVAVSHKEVEVAGGMYMPGPEELLKIRGHIAEHHKELERMLAARKLVSAVGELQGTSLTRPPKGWPADHPATALLKKKQWYFDVLLDASLASSPEMFSEVAARFRVMTPVIDFFNTPLLARKRQAYF